jgi:cellulose synthase (UDP-forming)
VKALADDMGVRYISRFKGRHAKAGNINNSLKTVLGQARKPAFLLLLDADFVPNSTILRRTLGLMEEEDVGIIQTPQHFFNHDPVQVNLLCTGVWPDEQRFFFNELLPSRDAWGTASCCGTSAVLRAAAIMAVGGFATETVTEDTLTSLKLKEFGYRTIYLNEPLSLGLAPESLREYVTQRSRWCLGSIQQLFTRYAFYGSASISFLDRLSSFDTVLYWMGGAPFKIMMWLGPALYWWTGTSVLRSDGAGLMMWLAPALASNILFMRYYSGNRVIPIVTDVSQLLSAPTICRTVLQGLIKPFGQPFKVTAKGISTEKTVVHWGLLFPFASIAVMTAVGMCMNLSGFSPERGADGFSLNMVWSIVAIAVLCLSILACVERPKRRRSERYQCNEEVRVSFSRGTDNDLEHVSCTLTELSLGGAQITLPDDWVGAPPSVGRLVLNHGRIQVDFRLVRRLTDSIMAVYFEPSQEVYRALLVKLYTTGRYNLEIENISILATLNRLALTLLT